jgi:hypothetical protein
MNHAVTSFKSEFFLQERAYTVMVDNLMWHTDMKNYRTMQHRIRRNVFKNLFGDRLGGLDEFSAKT